MCGGPACPCTTSACSYRWRYYSCGDLQCDILCSHRKKPEQASGHVPAGKLSHGGVITFGHQQCFVALMQHSICDIEQQTWPETYESRYRQRRPRAYECIATLTQSLTDKDEGNKPNSVKIIAMPKLVRCESLCVARQQLLPAPIPFSSLVKVTESFWPRNNRPPTGPLLIGCYRARALLVA